MFRRLLGYLGFVVTVACVAALWCEMGLVRCVAVCAAVWLWYLSLVQFSVNVRAIFYSRESVQRHLKG